MNLLRTLSFILVMSVACGSGGGGTGNVPPDSGAAGPTGVPILAVNGTISAAGRDVVPTHGVAGFNKTGTAVGVIISDAPMDCSALTADYTSKNMPAAGTYVAVAISNFDVGVAPKNMVQFMIIPKSKLGSIGGGGSNTGTVEVTEASDAAVTLKIEYRDTLSDGDYTVSGSFTVTRCP
jgi:hypothetical protein